MRAFNVFQGKLTLSVLVFLLVASLQTSADPLPRAADASDIDDAAAAVELEEPAKETPAQLDRDEQGRPIIRVKFEDLEIEAPAYEDKIDQFTDKRRQFDRELFADLTKFFEMTSKKLFHDGMSMFRFGVTNLGAIVGLFTNNKKKFNNFEKESHDTSPKMAKNYGAAMGQMMHQLADARSDTKMDGKQAHAYTVKSLRAFQALVDISPVGLYLDWGKMKINGKSLPEFMAPLMQRLRDEGRGPVLTVFHKVADIMIKQGLS